MSFKDKFQWTIGEICEMTGVSRYYFEHHWRNRKEFPNPIMNSANKVTYRGTKLQEFMEKLEKNGE